MFTLDTAEKEPLEGWYKEYIKMLLCKSCLNPKEFHEQQALRLQEEVL